MSEEFKERLRKYSEGSLPEEERAEMEQELEKLEAYQSYLDELMEQEDKQSAQKAAWNSGRMPAQGGANPQLKKKKRRHPERSGSSAGASGRPASLIP